MKNRTLFFAVCAIGLSLGSIPLSGCSYLKARAARAAYAEYQAALASGDMPRARNALVALVHTDEDVPDYWVELGKLQLQMTQYREAYDSFSHAHELDRSNTHVLEAMAQLALLSGELDLAQDQAHSLAMLSPDNPVVTLIDSHIALRSGDLDKAEAGADKVIAGEPTNQFAKVLKARVLIARGRTDDAIALLEAQHRALAQDRFTIRALTAIYRSRGDWRNVARIQADAHRLDPGDTTIALNALEAELRSGNVAGARQLSGPLLASSASLAMVDRTLDLWGRYAPHGSAMPDAMKLASAASAGGRVSFANYFNAVGRPADAAALLGQAQLPISHANARLNAVLAESMALQGRLPDARRLFDLVLEREPDQPEALRGRVALETRGGAVRQAVIDAQRLVTISPDSGQDRILLAQAYLAARNGTEVRRTLWQAFQDLPDDERVLSALKSVLTSSGDVDGLRRLSDEFADRQQLKLAKELV